MLSSSFRSLSRSFSIRLPSSAVFPSLPVFPRLFSTQANSNSTSTAPEFRGRWFKLLNAPSVAAPPPNTLGAWIYQKITTKKSNELHQIGREMFRKVAKHSGWNPSFYQWSGLPTEYFNGTIPILVFHVVLIHMRIEPQGNIIEKWKLAKYNRELFWHLWADMEWEVEDAAGSLRADKAMTDIQRRVIYMIDQLRDAIKEHVKQEHVDKNDLKAILNNPLLYRGPNSLSAILWRFVYGASEDAGTKRHVRQFTMYYLANWLHFERIPIDAMRRNEFEFVDPTVIDSYFTELERAGITGDPRDEDVREWSRLNETDKQKEKEKRTEQK